VIRLERLENRDTPANLIPGWTGGEQIRLAHVNSDAELDTVVVALEGGSCRVMVFDGNGRAETGEVLLNEIVFDPNFRGGGSVAVIPYSVGGPQAESDALIVVPGAGGGPQVMQFNFDRNGRVISSLSQYAPYAESFRGGLRAIPGDIDGDGLPEALFLPVNGAPHLTAIDMRTHETELSIYVGDPSETGARFEPTGAVIRTTGGETGIVIQYEDTADLRARSEVWSVSGERIPV